MELTVAKQHFDRTVCDFMVVGRSRLFCFEQHAVLDLARREVAAVRRHGYLLATVATKPALER